MLNLRLMKSICGYIFRCLLLLAIIQPLEGQDTLRTYGPRIGLDLVRFGYFLAEPSEIGAEFSVDAEVFHNVYPIIEAGYNQISEKRELFNYSSKGTYARAGVDYNLLTPKDRSQHHSITIGFRYGISIFNQLAEDVVIPGDYWGDNILESYQNNLTGNWFEIVGGVKTELVSNFFLGWSVRYKKLFNPGMDPTVTPQLVPGYGKGSSDTGFGFTYSILYKIPLFKK